MPNITDKQIKKLIIFQQAELDAVIMYQNLAACIKNPAVSNALKELAKDEGCHAAVLFKLTQKKIKPKKALSNLVVCVLKVCGAKLLFPIIAKQEYAAGKLYAHYVSEFPELKTVQQDETSHGDKIKELIKLL